MTERDPGHDQEHDQDTVGGGPDEPVTVTDRRRIDPETGEVRTGGTEPESSGGKGESGSGPATEPSDKEAELLADLQRLQAEYANYRRRADRERLGAVESGKATLINALLPVLDDLDRARAHGDLDSGPLRGVADKIAETLTSQGLSAFGSAGDAFDPGLHEAVQHDGEGSDPIIGAVYRQGYRLGERLLRTAMVTVTDAGGPAPDSDA